MSKTFYVATKEVINEEAGYYYSYIDGNPHEVRLNNVSADFICARVLKFDEHEMDAHCTVTIDEFAIRLMQAESSSEHFGKDHQFVKDVLHKLRQSLIFGLDNKATHFYVA